MKISSLQSLDRPTVDGLVLLALEDCSPSTFTPLCQGQVAVDVNCVHVQKTIQQIRNNVIHPCTCVAFVHKNKNGQNSYPLSLILFFFTPLVIHLSCMH